MKYLDAKVVFQEVPDEITLAISITGCINKCEGCHSPQLREDIGTELNCTELGKLILDNKGITCVCFMGGDGNPEGISDLAYYTKLIDSNLKTAWYSGCEKISKGINLRNLDYLKIGHYDKDRGPLNNPNTNQIFYKVIHTDVPSDILMDITHRFWIKHKDL